MRRLLPVVLVLLIAPAAAAHSYQDPELRTVLDDVRPALPQGVEVALVPSVVDELVVTNATTQPLEVLSADGTPYVRVSRAGVDANLTDPDWYLTAVPEDGIAPPAARAGAVPRWARVSSGSTWSVFDPRSRPPVTVTPELRRSGQRRVMTSWRIPLRYGGRPVEATGEVLLDPVRGGLVVATTHVPAGLTATPLQGELPGLFLKVPSTQTVEVGDRTGGPFLRFRRGVVQAWAASTSWREDQEAAGKAVSGFGWMTVGSGGAYSWLDSRLRYPHDLPPEDVIAKRTVVQTWRIPLTVDGRATEIDGTVTWIPRAQGLREVLGKKAATSTWPWLVGAIGVIFLVPVARMVSKRRRMS